MVVFRFVGLAFWHRLILLWRACFFFFPPFLFFLEPQAGWLAGLEASKLIVDPV